MISLKQCSKCGETKPLAGFGRDPRYRLGVRGQCKVCTAARMRLWEKSHPESQLRQKAKSHSKERAREYSRSVREADPETVRARSARSYQKHVAKRRAESTMWARANPDRAKARNVNYFARLRGAPGNGISSGDLAQLRADSLGICAYCNESKPLSLDHIEPVRAGGAHDPENATMSCVSCNSSKHDTTLLVWLARGGYLGRSSRCR